MLEVARAIREHRHTGSSQALLEFGAKEGDYEAIEGVPGDCEYVYGLRIVCGEAIILFAPSPIGEDASVVVPAPTSDVAFLTLLNEEVKLYNQCLAERHPDEEPLEPIV